MTCSMQTLPPRDATAVIFVSLRTDEDEAGYGAAAEAMDRLAATQPGYLGIVSARGADGLGITVSYWADEESAVAWRRNAEHAAIRELGRARWYANYRLIVTRVTRAYDWQHSVPPEE
jgi:heme-degrading monooxygenase HmoA